MMCPFSILMFLQRWDILDHFLKIGKSDHAVKEMECFFSVVAVKKHYLGNNNQSSVYHTLLTSSYDELDFICNEYKCYLAQVEQEQFLRAKEYARREKENATKSGMLQSIKIGERCTGNCSTCNRTECIEEKRQ